jgi:hypothetical protein
MTGQPDSPLRYRPRYGSPGTPADRRCSVCQTGRVSARARYCSTACKQHAYRLRQAAPPAADLEALTADLRRLQTLVAHRLYECPACLRSVPSKSVTARSPRDEGLEQEVPF